MRSLITLKALTYRPRAASSPRRRRRCPSRSAAHATGTTATAGYGTPPSRCRHCSPPATSTRPRHGGSGSCAQWPATRPTCRSCTASTAPDACPKRNCPGSPGTRQSRPVRTGNAASDQLQLDVWGETLDGLALARNAGISAHDDAWDLQTALMDHLEGDWHQPDNGLWEVRGARRHFTHSKVMAWVAADRMAQAVRDHDLPGPADRWEALKETIHADVLAHGYDADANTFVQSYGSTALDASLLLIPRVGFLTPTTHGCWAPSPPSSRGLTEDGLVMRYKTTHADDGLPGGEGVFLACSFWLVDALSWPDRRGPPSSSSNGCCACATTSACSARNGTPLPAGSSATPRKPSATSPSSPAAWRCRRSRRRRPTRRSSAEPRESPRWVAANRLPAAVLEASRTATNDRPRWDSASGTACRLRTGTRRRADVASSTSVERRSSSRFWWLRQVRFG